MNKRKGEKMKITSDAIHMGIIEDKYGIRGTQKNRLGFPTYSIPVKIEEAPDNTKSFALVLEDTNVLSATKEPIIHWLVANITKTEILENESLLATDFVQGRTSWAKDETQLEACMYTGMMPQSLPRVYQLHIFALDEILNLKIGFSYEELEKKMQTHILAEETIKGVYANC